MENVLIVLSSVTYARRVQKEGEKQGIYISIGHTPKKISVKGCSYMVKFRKKDFNSVKKIIDNLMLKTYGIYIERGAGNYDIFR